MAKKQKQAKAEAAPQRSAPPAIRDNPPPDRTPEVCGELTACPACGSTNRTGYTNRVELAFTGVHNGRPFDHIVWRTTQCVDCCQVRRDKHHEQRGPVVEPVGH